MQQKMKSKGKSPDMNKDNGEMAKKADMKRKAATMPKGRHNQPKGSSDSSAKKQTKTSKMESHYMTESDSMRQMRS